MTTASKIIDAFGGTTSMAALFGVGPTAVSNWRARNSIPARLHYRVAREAARRGIVIPDEVFGVGRPEDAPSEDAA